MSRSVVAYVVCLVAGGLLAPTLVPVLGSPLLYWGIVLVVGGLVSWRVGSSGGAAGGDGGFLRAGEFLCDRCRYDDPRDCSRPERPNATRCDDYRPR